MYIEQMHCHACMGVLFILCNTLGTIYNEGHHPTLHHTAHRAGALPCWTQLTSVNGPVVCQAMLSNTLGANHNEWHHHAPYIEQVHCHACMVVPLILCNTLGAVHNELHHHTAHRAGALPCWPQGTSVNCLVVCQALLYNTLGATMNGTTTHRT